MITLIHSCPDKLVSITILRSLVWDSRSEYRPRPTRPGLRTIPWPMLPALLLLLHHRHHRPCRASLPVLRCIRPHERKTCHQVKVQHWRDRARFSHYTLLQVSPTSIDGDPPSNQLLSVNPLAFHWYGMNWHCNLQSLVCLLPVSAIDLNCTTCTTCACTTCTTCTTCIQYRCCAVLQEIREVEKFSQV